MANTPTLSQQIEMLEEILSETEGVIATLEAVSPELAEQAKEGRDNIVRKLEILERQREFRSMARRLTAEEQAESDARDAAIEAGSDWE